MFNSFDWPLPLWFPSRVVPGARKTIKARTALYDLLLAWHKSGGLKTASDAIKAIVGVSEDAQSPPDIGSKFLNMMMVANTPEALGWMFTPILQAPALFQVIREECDVLQGDSIVNTNFKTATPHLYSAFFETFRLLCFHRHTGHSDESLHCVWHGRPCLPAW